MQIVTMRSITIIADRTILTPLAEHFRKWGVGNYSLYESRARTVNSSSDKHSQTAHIRIEAVVPDSVAAEVSRGLESEFFKSFSITYFECDTFVRSEDLRQGCNAPSTSAPREVAWGDYLITL
jgi:hypothetical protein